MSYCKRITLIASLFAFHVSIAQNVNFTNYTFERIGAEEGIDYCTQIVMDNNGFLWIGSFNGLYRYDGKFFTHYGLTDGLPDNSLTLLTKDRAGNIYTGSATGVSCFTGGSPHKFKYYPATNGVTAMEALCAVDTNHVFIGSNELPGLYYLHNDSMVILPGINKPVCSIAADKSGNVYAWADNGTLYRVINDTCRLINFEPSTAGMLYHLLYTDADGEVFFYNGKSLRKLVQSKLVNIIMPTAFIPAFNVKAGIGNNSIIVSSVDCFYKLSPNKIDTLCYGKSSVFKQIRGIAEDKSGAYYFTDDYGIYRLQLKLGNLKTIKTRNETLNYYYTNAAGEKVPGNISNKTLKALPKKDLTLLKAFEKNGHIQLYKDRHDTLWLSTRVGLYTINGGLKLRYITPPYWEHGYDSTFMKMEESKEGTLWIASDNGLISYKNGVFRQYIPPGDPYGRIVYVAQVSKQGNIVISTANGPFILQNNSFIDLCNLLHLPRGLYLSFYQTSTGKIIFYQSDHIYVVTPSANSYVLSNVLSLKWGDKTSVVSRFITDRHDNIWVYSGKELVVFFKDKAGNYRDDNRRCFTGADGLRTESNHESILARYGNETILLCKKDSAQQFDISQLLTQYKPTPVTATLTGLLLYRVLPDWRQLGFAVNNVGVPLQPVLNHTQNYLTFQFAAVDHRHADYITYRYELTGVDKGWQPVTSDKGADYNNLLPGKYSFKLQAADINGIWSHTVIYTFTILSPWYATWWAYTIAGILFVGAVAVVFYLRLLGLRKKDSVEKIITEQKLIALRAQINPHFLQNTFEFLGNRLRIDTIDGIVGALSQVSGYLRQVLYRSDKIVVSLEEEINFIERFWEMQQTLHMNSFTYSINISKEADIFGAQVLSMMLQPIAENALKHGITAGCKKNHVALTVAEDEQYIYCHISDSGNHEINSTNKAPGYVSTGNQLTIKRMQLLYRSFKLKPFIQESQLENGGLRVTLALPKK